MNNETLLVKLSDPIKRERVLLVEILDYLKKVYDRRLHVEMGYENLYKFMIRELGYSSSQAQRWWEALKLVEWVPEVRTKIEEGLLNITQANQLQQTFGEADNVQVWKDWKREASNTGLGVV